MTIRRGTTRSIALWLSVALPATLLAACTSSKPHPSPPHSSPAATPTAPAITTKATFAGHGSIDQAYVVGATPGQRLVLADATSHQAGEGIVDRLGSLNVINVTPGDGYTFRAVQGATVAGTGPFRVQSPDDTPAPGLYSGQKMVEGLNYITMRDGIELAATVRLPLGKSIADGPFPTVIEYSGYQVAAPHSLLQATLNPGSGGADPLLPDTSTAVGSIIAPLLGFASVSLQMRGSGCSGGAFDLFGLDTTYDGYDAVQIVGSQPWVRAHKVGLVGISFSGISQLFVAGTRPPDLAAIAALSVTDDLYSTGDPGGILNNGFAASWIAERMADAQPAPGGGQPYARALVNQGDQHCLANQALRLQTPDARAQLQQSAFRDPAVFDIRSPAQWAKRIDVPVFMVGAFQDEQTGGQWSNLVPNLAGDPQVWVTLVNGTHVDSLGPASITRWIEFLDLFVADKVPSRPAFITSLGSTLYRQAAGAPAEPLPAIRFTDVASVDAARTAFEQDPRVRVLFDNGGGSAGPGAFQPEWEAAFTAWPPSGLSATRLYLGSGGALSASPPAAASATFHPDPAARPRTSLAASANPWAPLPPYDWAPVTGTSGLGFVTAPLTQDLVAAGPASLDLWLRSTAADTDLQVAISEVRPDGKELYIQSGFLRASDRALVGASSAVHPVPTFRAVDAAPLPPGQFTLVRVPIFPFAYAFRAGSRIRITISAPGGDRPAWAFDTPATQGSVIDTAEFGGSGPSALVLPVIADLTPPDSQPACPSLRGQPCRAYVAAGNGG